MIISPPDIGDNHPSPTLSEANAHLLSFVELSISSSKLHRTKVKSTFACSIIFDPHRHSKVWGGKYSIYQRVQAAIEWSAVCLSEYRQLKPLTASTLITLPLFVNTFSYYPKHTGFYLVETAPERKVITSTRLLLLASAPRVSLNLYSGPLYIRRP